MAVSLAAPAAASAAGWLAPVNVSGTVTGGMNAQVASNARGDTIVGWQHGNGAAVTVQASLRSAGGTFSPPVTVAAAGETAAYPRVGIDDAGNAVVVWRRDVAGQGTVRAALKPAGGAFAPPVDVSAAGENAGPPRVAVGRGGSGVVTWLRTDGAHAVVRALVRSAAGVTAGPFDVSSGSEDAQDPDVAVDRTGNATVVWTANGVVKRSERPADGAFSPPVQVSAAGEFVIYPTVAMGDAGAATISWSRRASGAWQPRASFRAGGGTFAPPVDVAPATAAGSTVVRTNARGDALFIWESYENERLGARAVVHSAGAFGPILNLSDNGAVPAGAINEGGDVFLAWRDYQGDNGDFLVRLRGAKVAAGTSTLLQNRIISPVAGEHDAPDVAAAAAGDAVVVWRPVGIAVGGSPNWENISSGSIGAAQFDGTAPDLTSVTVPATAVAGTAIAMSAFATDVWSTPSITFDFGDGASRAGTSVSHAYAAAGTYRVTMTAVDAAGNTTTATRTLTVTAAPAAGPESTPTPLPTSPGPESTPTPLPASPGPGGDSSALKAPTISGKSKLGKLRVPAKGKLAVPVRVVCEGAGPACTGTLSFRVGKKTLGKVSFEVAGGKSAKLSVALPAKLRKQVTTQGTSFTLTVVVTRVSLKTSKTMTATLKR